MAVAVAVAVAVGSCMATLLCVERGRHYGDQADWRACVGIEGCGCEGFRFRVSGGVWEFTVSVDEAEDPRPYCIDQRGDFA